MRRSHALQLLGAIIVFLVIVSALLFSSYAQAASNNDSVQSASMLAIATLGGSFGGTTLFWLLFQCDFARRKKMRHMNERIEKLEKSNTIKNLETNIKTYINEYIEQTNRYIEQTIDSAVKKINNPKSADNKITSSNKEPKTGKESKPGDDDKN